ncbi:MAG: hypothetical protein HYS13_20470 [Planctomycetia bacterium]|nr:hypothetical protein [Planctomycetia bacterium]
MQPGTRVTLLEDWQARRRRLDDRPGDAYAPVQRQLLDFLIRRYRDSPEAQQPARFPLQSGTVVNTRQIIINHHLGQGKVAGVKSRAEAEHRVKRLVERLAEHSKIVASPEDALVVDPFAQPVLSVADEEFIRWRNELSNRNLRRLTDELLTTVCRKKGDFRAGDS